MKNRYILQCFDVEVEKIANLISIVVGADSITEATSKAMEIAKRQKYLVQEIYVDYFLEHKRGVSNDVISPVIDELYREGNKQIDKLIGDLKKKSGK